MKAGLYNYDMEHVFNLSTSILYHTITFMKLAVTGKGGVGKTTISALMAYSLKSAGHNVVAIDADPDSNLLACMGYADASEIKPLVELKSLIEERMGVAPGTTGGMFRLNPFIEDIPEKYSVDIDGIRVLVAGAVKKGGAGCYCPENSLLRALISHLLLEKDMSLVIDMEAGVEHLTRGTVQAVDHLLIAADPGRRGIETALRIKGLADEIGLKRISVVGNKIRSEADEKFLRDALPGMEMAGFIPYDESLLDAERSGNGVKGASGEVFGAVEKILSIIEKD